MKKACRVTDDEKSVPPMPKHESSRTRNPKFAFNSKLIWGIFIWLAATAEALNLRLLKHTTRLSGAGTSIAQPTLAVTEKVSHAKSNVTPKTSSSVLGSTVSSAPRVDESVTSALFRKPALIGEGQIEEVTPSRERRTLKRRLRPERPMVSSIDDLRNRVVDKGVPLKDLNVQLDIGTYTPSQVLTHDVLQVLGERFHSKSTPGHRTDTHHLSLAIEGGGMRGAVSAGMSAAIACLGLVDSFDSIYGSSAGSVIGAYLVSRQMCMDVYVDILTAAKKKFVCTKRLVGSLAKSGMELVLPEYLKRWSLSSSATLPGMNISFVLDGVMDHVDGIRPLDMERFLENDKRQPLKIASSYVENGQLGTRAFSSKDFDKVSRGFVPTGKSSEEDGGDEGPQKQKQRLGIYTCLESSMTVPGATGPPVPVIFNDAEGTNTTAASVPHFDAFCFEPLPYRSAVEDGATHVLCLCSRPEGFQPKSTPGVYELGVAPLYFHSHGEPEVASFFERGGQQYIYAEDLLTLEQGKRQGIFKEGPVVVPPPKVLYGVDEVEDKEAKASRDRSKWNTAHLYPMKVPMGTPELPTLEQDRDAVLEAVRGGFAASFDLLAPVVGLDIDISGSDIARLVFPDEFAAESAESLLEEQLRVKGDAIPEVAPEPENRRRRLVSLFGRFRSIRLKRRNQMKDPSITGVLRRRKRRRRQQKEASMPSNSRPNFVDIYAGIATENANFQSDRDLLDPQSLLEVLPGFQAGRMSHLARGLQVVKKTEA